MGFERSDNVLPFWLAQKRVGHKVCLVTLIGIDGSAPRPLGSQIAVSEDGKSQGYITGGCAEAAIVAEAQSAMAKHENRTVRYGEGSPYKDIALPCGSGIDVYFDMGLKLEQVDQIMSGLDERKPSCLITDVNNQKSRVSSATGALPKFNNGIFTKPYTPSFKLFIAGKGPVVPALASLAVQSGFLVELASPELETLESATDQVLTKLHLTSPEAYAPTALDQWCAAVTLFHDHEWEPPILIHFLNSPCFYVGALGSRETHKKRLKLLEEQGLARGQRDQVRGPVGLDIQAITPTEVAISILAEIIQTHRMKERGPARWKR